MSSHVDHFQEEIDEELLQDGHGLALPAVGVLGMTTPQGPAGPGASVGVAFVVDELKELPTLGTGPVHLVALASGATGVGVDLGGGQDPGWHVVRGWDDVLVTSGDGVFQGVARHASNVEKHASDSIRDPVVGLLETRGQLAIA